MIRLWSADAPLTWSELEPLEPEDAAAERPTQPVGRPDPIAPSPTTMASQSRWTSCIRRC